jgi:hypothetical protein
MKRLNFTLLLVFPTPPLQTPPSTSTGMTLFAFAFQGISGSYCSGAKKQAHPKSPTPFTRFWFVGLCRGNQRGVEGNIQPNWQKLSWLLGSCVERYLRITAVLPVQVTLSARQARATRNWAIFCGRLLLWSVPGDYFPEHRLQLVSFVV